MIKCKPKVIGAGKTVTAIFLMAGPYFLKANINRNGLKSTDGVSK